MSEPRLELVETPSAGGALDFARDVREGLAARPRHVPCAYLYDDEGSRLFEAICEQPEYYLTRAETEILRARAGEIAARMGGDVELVELGSGNARKTRLVIEALLARQRSLRYLPIDISTSILAESARGLLHDYPGLRIMALAAEYEVGLGYLAGGAHGRRLVLWLGSNVGNFAPSEAATFLRQVGRALSPDDRLLVGVDLRKAREPLEAAYDDAAGATARFDRNLLLRIDRELGGHFAVERFRHRARWHEDEGRVSMELVSEAPQSVAIDRLGMRIDLAAGEPIHTEDSWKYSYEEIDRLVAEGAFAVEARWLDGQRRLSLNLLSPR